MLTTVNRNRSQICFVRYRGHELQAAAGTLGRCLGVLGSRPNWARHYANLLPSAIPILLSLASNESVSFCCKCYLKYISKDIGYINR